MEPIPEAQIREAVRAALEEDLGPGDATTLATVPLEARMSVVMAARERLVVCGLAFVSEAFRQLSRDVTITAGLRDGDLAEAGASLLEIAGDARSILTAERVALNFGQRLSGVATATRAFADAVAGTKARILDTRKTTPGWRRFEKYAVACGGGQNHRFGLFDLILIKDNHLAALRDARPNAVAAAIARAREYYPKLKVEVEADTLEQARQGVEAGADIVLLDNMSLEQLRTAVTMIGSRAKTEASGGVTLSSVRAIAETGVDYISVGAITHSARSVDIGLDFIS